MAARPSSRRRAPLRVSSATDPRCRPPAQQRDLRPPAKPCRGMLSELGVEPRARRPWRPGVGGLVERRRHPRQVEQDDRRRRRSAPSRSSPPRRGFGRQQPQAAPRHDLAQKEEQRPVVGVQERPRATARSPRWASRARSRSSPGREDVRSERRAGDEPASSATSAYMRVSCAYCVRNGLCGLLERGARRAVHPARSPNIARALPPRHRDRKASANSSESAWVASSVSSRDGNPEVQQQVVQGRRAVHLAAQQMSSRGRSAMPTEIPSSIQKPSAEHPSCAGSASRAIKQAEARRDREGRAGERPKPAGHAGRGGGGGRRGGSRRGRPPHDHPLTHCGTGATGEKRRSRDGAGSRARR